ncbi:MAG: site-specific DNA-methyltransferase [Candidatus Angelobacter sp. Gp1-AA117]|nr:MAG: site-specific DNA-methyltransferase [Candidatus Angelobacter sp. Gp1-AA117]
MRREKPIHEDHSGLPLDTIIKGDCRNVLKTFPDASVDLVVTSPPYADSRKHTYGGVSPDEYVAWFLLITSELHRVLKPTGSFILNIKERVKDGERHTYVLELILALRKQEWLWTEEYIWHKKNCYPGKWPNRFRDAWERCLHFTKNKNFHMYQDAVRVPMGKWAETRLAKLSNTDRIRDESKVKSGFGKNVSNWLGRNTVYPTNVLHLATECSNRNHSAAFPESLPAWFIKLFTNPGDIVLDPFVGSGTTAVAAMALDRRYVGIELTDEHYAHALESVARAKRAKSGLQLV